MNTKFILPGGLALTFHAFLLFGLTGKTPRAAVIPDHPAPRETGCALTVDPDDPAIQPASPPDEQLSSKGGPAAPRLPDIPVVNPPPGAPTIPPIPAIPGDRSTVTIPLTWQNPRGPGKGRDHDVIDWTKLDRTPQARSQPAPDYPADLLKSGIEGTVEVEFLVDGEGNVHSPIALRASHPGFIEPALRAVARWRFEPGRSAGRIVRFRMSVPLVFTIGGR